jgi:hypothetical protein
MGKVRDVPRPLGEIVQHVLARGDDSAPQDSRGAWSEERLAGWRTDPDVTARLAALTSLDFSEDVLETSRSLGPGVGDKVKRMLSSQCFLCVCTCIVSSFHCLCSRMLSVWRSFLCVCMYLRVCPFFLSTAQGKENQWVIENNLAHLLEYTPTLKTLHVPLRSVSFRLMDCGGLACTPPPIARPCPLPCSP